MIAEIVSGLIQGVYNIVEELFTTCKKKETVEQHIAKSDVVYQKLLFLLKKLEASRIYIRQYHNGGKFYSGQPIQRISCTYEAIADGISPMFARLQNNFVSEAPSLHSAIISDKEIFIPDVKTFEDQVIRQKFQERGVTTYYSIGIWGLDGSLIGILCVDYVNMKHALSMDEKACLAQFATQSVGYIAKDDDKTSSSVNIKVAVACLIFLFITESFVALIPLIKIIVEIAKKFGLTLYL